MCRNCLTLVLLVLLGGLFAAQDVNPPKPQPVRAMDLYAQAGRSWAYRDITWVRGEQSVVKTESHSISKLVEGVADCVATSVSVGQRDFSSWTYTVAAGDVPEEQAAWIADTVPEVELDAGFRKFKCRKHSKTEQEVQTTTWVSTEYHPLVVKQVVIQPGSTYIRKLTAFNAAEVDPFLLYRMQGRRWKMKSLMNMGNDTVETYTEYKVKEVRDSGATLTLSSLDAAGKVMFSSDSEIAFKVAAVEEPRQPSPKQESKECEAGAFDCYVTETNGTKAWTSTRWPGLAIAMSSKTFDMELVEFDLGHDQHKFYQKAGNYYVMKTVVHMQAMDSESTWRMEVKSVKDRDVTYELVYFDNRGNEIMRQESKLELPQEVEPTKYDGQVEEMVETPAGRFPALRTEGELGGEGSQVTWTWNGIAVKTEMHMDGYDATTEATELNVQ